MKEELYINDNRIDLGKDTITLKHQSNFLGDITKITTSHSYTVKVPRTQNNINIFQNSDMPAIASRPPSGSKPVLRRFSNAKYLRNGVELFTGQAVLMETNEYYFSLVLTWGKLLQLAEFLKDSPKLNEAFSFLDFSLLWSPNSIYLHPNYFQNYHNGINETQLINVHPCISLEEILNLIQIKFDLNFIFPEWLDDRLATTVLLCMTKNDNIQSMQNYPFRAKCTFPFDLFVPTINHDIKFDIIANNNIFEHTIEEIEDTIRTYSKLTITKNLTSLNIYLTFKVVNTTSAALHLTVFKNGEYYDTQTLNQVPTGNTNEYSCTFSKIYGSFDENDYLSFRVVTTASVAFIFYNDDSRIYGTLENQDDNISQELVYPAWFPLYSNLPDINLLDFIKSICWMFGMFAYRHLYDDSNIIRFNDVGLLLRNKSVAQDWSDKIVDIFKDVPEQMKFRYNDMGQQNILSYKKDENDTAISEAQIIVDDETIDLNKELIILPFAATNNIRRGDAKIPQYSLEFDDEGNKKVIFNKLEPRILRKGHSFLIFKSPTSPLFAAEGIDFPTLKTKFYSDYQNLVLRPVILTERFRLTELDLKMLDFSKPVYLKQYGRYYAIISVTDQKGICTAELLQLPINE